MQDNEYRIFAAKLMPNIPFDRVIGIKTPMLRDYAKSLSNAEAEAFMAELPHEYYEENNLHAFLIERIKDFDECISELNRFLPFVDNWATCDSMRPKMLSKHKDKLLPQIKLWLKAEDAYTVRFAMLMLMTHYLDGDYKPEYLQLVASVNGGEDYYINMMQAWYFATALAKQYADAVVFLRERRLSRWVHNKTISKAHDSYRISSDQKKYLKTLRY